MVEHTTSTRAAPDLSHLPLDVQVRIEVAETQGATWTRDYVGTRWWLVPAGKPDDRLFTVKDDGGTWDWGLPKVLTDPAAWGALMERERISVIATFAVGGVPEWLARFARPNGSRTASAPGRAVCLAVLAKYGRDTSRYMEEANG